MITIQQLTKNCEKLYVYLEDSETQKQFAQMAEKEGFVFADGEKPTLRRCDEIMCVNQTGIINYLGTYGRAAFGAGAQRIGDLKLARIDFKRLLADELL